MPHQTAVTTLEGLIESGAFASQAKEPEPFDLKQIEDYPKVVAKLGREDAERQLMDFLGQRAAEAQRVTFAASIESTARGVLALAKAREDSLIDVTNCRTGMYSPIKSMYGPRHKFIMMNKISSAGGTWHPHGAAGLQAVILETGYTEGGPVAIMTLALPAWARVRQTVSRGTILCVAIRSTGLRMFDTYSLERVEAGKEQPVTDSNLVLQHLLGISRLGGWISSGNMSGDPNTLGFPGAEDYFATHLPQLGPHFKAMAKAVAKQH